MGDGDFDLEMELFEQRLQSGLDEHIQALMEASYLASCKGAPQGS